MAKLTIRDAQVTDRNYWLKRGTEKTVKIADKMLEMMNSINPGFNA